MIIVRGQGFDSPQLHKKRHQIKYGKGFHVFGSKKGSKMSDFFAGYSNPTLQLQLSLILLQINSLRLFYFILVCLMVSL